MAAPAVILPRSNEFFGRGLDLAVVAIIFTILSLFLVIVRLGSKLGHISHSNKIGKDDYAIVASMVSWPYAW